VVLHREEVDSTMANIVLKMASYESDWKKNVETFALAASRFFNLA